ncbi:cysteine-rich repeat secretory protein 38-like [Panicum virgatum]|uniref:cysteine-rich repeat secretory protein 38-like n=1 Tax=Panicum virgatum TaxID=38727 RepID=UPI0019D5E971|nr:cysteine-rich repeat secretory protein 38-like [Panicum virgatum]
MATRSPARDHGRHQHYSDFSDPTSPSAKIQRRSPVPPKGPSYTHRTNLHAASPLPPRSGAGIGASDAHHSGGALPHHHRQAAMNGLLPLIFLLLPATTNADDLGYYITGACSNNMNYTRGSAFQANHDAILSSLPAAAAASSGFAENVTGAAPDLAYSLAQCRGDASASECRSCLDGAVRDMAALCPVQKSAVLIYEGCLLRLSNASFFGRVKTSRTTYVCSSHKASSPDFNSSLGALMSGLAEKAYGSPRMFAVGAVNHTPYEKIHGMARCTQDLSRDDCHSCLAKAVRIIPDCCPGRSGGRIFFWSSSIRYEVGPFYNIQLAEAAMSPSPAPAPAPGGGPLFNGGDHYPVPRCKV